MWSVHALSGSWKWGTPPHRDNQQGKSRDAKTGAIDGYGSNEGGNGVQPHGGPFASVNSSAADSRIEVLLEEPVGTISPSVYQSHQGATSVRTEFVTPRVSY